MLRDEEILSLLALHEFRYTIWVFSSKLNLYQGKNLEGKQYLTFYGCFINQPNL